MDPESIPQDEFMGDSDEEAGPTTTDEIDKEQTLTTDGGLKKTIKVLGSGWETPAKGAEVTVHYTGTLLDGTKFDSSRDRDEPFVFKLGEKAVIRGWDEGVKTMKKGERAILTCSAEYAYGESGSPPKIPPNATLQFDVELISWTEWKDISTNKDKSVLKKVLKEGEGWEKPEFDTKAVVHWTVAKADTPEEIVETVPERQVTIGAEDVPPLVETALESMKKGEHALFHVTLAEAHGAAPANVLLQYDVHLESFEQAPKSWKLKGQEKLDAATAKKDEGSALFKEGKIARAIKKYKAALEFVSSDYDLTDAQKADIKPIKLAIHLNLAACSIKQGDWNGTIENANKALELQANNAKALLRRGKAYNELDRWAEAKRDLSSVLDSEGAAEIPDAKRELAKLQAKTRAHDAKEKKLYGGLFDRIRTMPAPPPVAPPPEEPVATKAPEAAKEDATPAKEDGAVPIEAES